MRPSLPSLAREAPAYVGLHREMHDALVAQYPEWILPNGNCPTCDSYDARYAELLVISLATERARADRSNNLTNTTKLPAPSVNHGERRWRSPVLDLDGPDKFSVPAEYARVTKVIFRKMPSAVRTWPGEKFA